MNFNAGQTINFDGRDYLVVEAREISGQIFIYIVNKRGRTLMYVVYYPVQKTFSKVTSTYSKLTKEEIDQIENTPQPQAEEVKEIESAEVIEEAMTESSTLETELAEAQEELTAHWAEVNRLETKVNQLKDKLAAAKLTQKAEVTEIVLTRAEGRIDQCITVAVKGWVEAEATLRRWARTAPSEGNGCHKCDVILTFSDEQSFRTRFELKQVHSFRLSLANEVMAELKFLAGVRPSHMTEKDYQGYLKMCKIDTAKYQQLLNKWVIPA